MIYFIPIGKRVARSDHHIVIVFNATTQERISIIHSGVEILLLNRTSQAFIINTSSCVGMTYLQKNTDPTTLVSRDHKPNLSCTVAFRRVIDTLPEGYPIPTSIIKFGLLTQHLEPKSSEYEVDKNNINTSSKSATAVPPQTLARIRWLLSNHTSDLNDSDKKRVGELCSTAGLNKPPQAGTSEIQEIQITSQASIEESVFHRNPSETAECEFCGSKFSSSASLNGHLASCSERQNENRSEKVSQQKEYECHNCGKSFRKKNALRVHKKRNCNEKQSSDSASEKRPAFGKEIRKDKGSERVSGRNPFADPEKIKDTGLHQGGN